MHCLPNGEQPRILLREFRRRSKQPKRWDSLPCLRLAPENRPLYVCPKCDFPNLVSALCPWCFRTCDVATLAVAVRRRVSSPTLLTDAQKMQLARIERQPRRSPLARGGGELPPAATSSPGPRATRVSQPDGASKAEPDDDNDSEDVRRRHRNAVLYSATDVVATATSDTTLQPFLDQIAAVRLQNRERERRSVFSTVTTPPPSVRTTRPPSSRASHPHPPQTPHTPTPVTRTTFIRMSVRDGDLTNTSEPYPYAPEASAPPSPSPSPSPSPCLRRKRRMPVLRQRSSCSLRRRAPTSSVGTFCRDGAASPPMSPRPKTATSFTSASPPGTPRPKAATSIRFSSPSPGASTESIPLGHPQRPLYTAIRKNMTRPESPSPPPTGARPSFDAAFQCQTIVYERQTRSLDIETPRFRSLSRASHLAMATSYARPAMFPTGGTGFSVSGETEMRMDLARSRSMDGVPSDYAFRERPQDASMKAKMKSLGKTLKGLLRGVKN
ncbi:hypothetical protein L226DRAFT_64155 [Lentinus tigrinus ALCF2SS1-7]|uniref:Uncharacterized protein n=1 Tax=Lentinus tigrinus ALCF2SS1-6 TaxID=1328759 RepID=A0A5C2S822_9APHY|nr:hypothetical protein L227DRAFT_104670 [Lentinus tigrinus ALCF2SS1-6]RPD74746.1 hypothetical protein L226DRAFT_64155 [Lentinus tigrinus ALCF2SS1-7]